jgi:hypothetical protein
MSEILNQMRKRMDVATGDFLPFPFCGKTPKVIRLMGYDYWKTEVSYCRFVGVDYDDVIQKLWNTRKDIKQYE